MQAVDEDGNKSDWSEAFKVTVDNEYVAAPELKVRVGATDLANGDATSSDTITAYWDKPDYAETYEYQYWNDISTSPWNAGNPWTTTVNTEERTGSFTEGEGTHFVRVRAVDSDGNKSEWSNTFEVTYDATGPSVTLQSPADGATVDGTVVNQTWTTTDTDVDYYEYSSFADAGETSPLIVEEQVNTQSRVTNNVADGTYYWKVRAIDVLGNVGAWSDLWEVTVENEDEEEGGNQGNNGSPQALNTPAADGPAGQVLFANFGPGNQPGNGNNQNDDDNDEENDQTLGATTDDENGQVASTSTGGVGGVDISLWWLVGLAVVILGTWFVTKKSSGDTL